MHVCEGRPRPARLGSEAVSVRAANSAGPQRPSGYLSQSRQGEAGRPSAAPEFPMMGTAIGGDRCGEDMLSVGPHRLWHHWTTMARMASLDDDNPDGSLPCMNPSRLIFACLIQGQRPALGAGIGCCSQRVWATCGYGRYVSKIKEGSQLFNAVNKVIHTQYICGGDSFLEFRRDASTSFSRQAFFSFFFLSFFFLVFSLLAMLPASLIPLT